MTNGAPSLIYFAKSLTIASWINLVVQCIVMSFYIFSLLHIVPWEDFTATEIYRPNFERRFLIFPVLGFITSIFVISSELIFAFVLCTKSSECIGHWKIYAVLSFAISLVLIMLPDFGNRDKFISSLIISALYASAFALASKITDEASTDGKAGGMSDCHRHEENVKEPLQSV